jgi:hypothetical protein
MASTQVVAIAVRKLLVEAFFMIGKGDAGDQFLAKDVALHRKATTKFLPGGRIDIWALGDAARSGGWRAADSADRPHARFYNYLIREERRDFNGKENA